MTNGRAGGGTWHARSAPGDATKRETLSTLDLFGHSVEHQFVLRGGHADTSSTANSSYER
jgi:hypothetical protein